MKLKTLKNRGGVDPTAWIIGITGFVSTYFVWSFVSPIMKSLITFGVGMMLPDIANQQFTFIDTLFNWAMVFNAGVWIVYIIFSSIREEVEESGFISGF